MTTWAKDELSHSWRPPTPEEIGRLRAIMAEKECHVVMVFGEDPKCYQEGMLGGSRAKAISVADLISSI